MAQGNFFLRQVVDVTIPQIEIMDIGASALDGESRYTILVHQGLGRVTGFEPDETQFRILGSVFLISLLISIAAIFMQVQGTARGTTFLSVASHIAPLTQQIPKAALAAMEGQKESFAELREARDAFAKLLESLVEGGEVKGIKVARQGFHDYARGSVVEGTDPRGYPYFWFGLHGIEHTKGHDSDLEAIADGYVSVTPLQLDLTHDASLHALRDRFA